MIKKRLLLVVVFAAIIAGIGSDRCQARHPLAVRRPAWRAQFYNWHGAYAHTEHGQPIAVVVPPTAQLQTNWSWGADAARVSRIDHQFGRNWPGPFAGGAGFYPTPAWPADTYHYGAYYVRAPW